MGNDKCDDNRGDERHSKRRRGENKNYGTGTVIKRMWNMKFRIVPGTIRGIGMIIKVGGNNWTRYTENI